MRRNTKRIELNNRRWYEDFRTLTPNKITTQWNNIKYAADKKRISMEELEYILQTTTNKKVYEEVVAIYNPKAKAYNKANTDQKHWYNKKERSAKAIQEVLEMNKEKKKAEREKKQEELKIKKRKELQEVINKTGIGKHQGTNFFFDYEGTLILNPDMMEKSLESKIKEIKEIGEDAEATPEEIDEAIRIAKQEYKTYQEEIKRSNKSKAKEIDKAALKRIEGFIFGQEDARTINGRHAGFFGYLIGKEEEKAKLKALVERLSPAERMALEELMLSSEFLKQWCSDQDSACYDSQFREARIDEVISIIENYIGEGIEYDTGTGEMRYYKLSSKHSISTEIKLEDYL